MRNSQVQRCIDYIRFTMELEGAELTDEDAEQLENILDDNADLPELFAAFIQKEQLDTNYIAGFDENERYPDSKCLVNYFNIKDKTKLRKVEHFFVNARTCELFAHPIDKPLSFSYLQSVHEHLFGDVYPSAGVLRTSNASKSTDFCRPEYISKMSAELFAKLGKDDFLKKIDDRDDFINDLAFYMGESEALHPFKDGNGRAIRFFFYRLIREAGYEVEWGEADPDRMLEASIAAIDGDYQSLIDVLEEIIVEA